MLATMVKCCAISHHGRWVINMKCAIIGAGSIGSLVAAQIATSTDTELLLCSKGDSALALMALGLQLQTPVGDVIVDPTRWIVVQNNAEIPNEWLNSTDVVMVCTKASATIEIAPIAARLLSSEGVVLSLQNGISNEHQLAEVCGRHRTIGALTTHGATRVSTGITRWAGEGEIVIGPLSSGISSSEPRFEAVFDMLQKSSLNPRISESIESELWSKLLLNCAINPIAAICGVTNGSLFSIQELHEQAISTMLEAAAIGRAIGIALASDEDLIDRLDTVLQSTAANECSMLQDIKRGVITEIDAINGEILKIAEKVGIPCPLNSQLVTLIKGIENSLSR